MKTIFLPIILALLLAGCQQKQEKTSDPDLVKSLTHFHETQDYFRLKNAFDRNEDALSDRDQLYFQAIVSNVFNQAETSNQAIEKLLETHPAGLSDTLLAEIYQIKLLNHINLYEYAEATKTSEVLLKEYRARLDSAVLEDLENEIHIWQGLKNVPKQRITKQKDCTVPLTQDKVGLQNVAVKFPAKEMNMIFDTGANISTIRRSLVDSLGMQVIEADFFVTSAMGTRVKSDLAIAEKFEIGEMALENVVFLILEDADVSFPQIDYYINGIIGFPVIEAMEEIRITEGKELFVPKSPDNYSEANFALEGLKPIVSATRKGDTLQFSFDSGATSTMLFNAYLDKYREEIEAEYQKDMLVSGSAGGLVQFEGYKDVNVRLKIGGSEAELKGLQLHIDDVGGKKNYLHGNLGQDYISQFETMVISFRDAHIGFK